jgi:hypothetical protein
MEIYMSDSEKSKKTLYAKAFFTAYGLGTDIVANYSAKRLNDVDCEITRGNGTKVIFAIGQDVPNCGPVSIDRNNNIQVGKFTVLVGENLASDWRAKKTKKKGEFLFRKKDGKSIRASIGDTVVGMGVVNGHDNHGNVSVGDWNIPIDAKLKELKLLVYNEKHEKYVTGHKCHFNFLLPGSKNNNENGIAGIFFPAKGNAPAKFCEIEPDNTLLCTATFWPSKSREFSIGNTRSIDDARIEKALVERLKELKTESEDLGILVSENQEYIETEKQLTAANKKWESNSFTVTNGKEAFGLNAESSYANEPRNK